MGLMGHNREGQGHVGGGGSTQHEHLVLDAIPSAASRHTRFVSSDMYVGCAILAGAQHQI